MKMYSYNIFDHIGYKVAKLCFVLGKLVYIFRVPLRYLIILLALILMSYNINPLYVVYNTFESLMYSTALAHPDNAN